MTRCTPGVASTLVNGMRRELIERGRWPDYERQIVEWEPGLARLFLRAESEEWVDFDGYVGFMNGLERILGSEGMKELGGIRFTTDLDVGGLAPILRSWLRELGTDHKALLRIAPHVWQAVTRDAGRMHLAGSEEASIVYTIEGGPPSLLTATGWHRSFEGFGEALLARAGLQGSIRVRPEPASSSLSLTGVWSPD